MAAQKKKSSPKSTASKDISKTTSKDISKTTPKDISKNKSKQKLPSSKSKTVHIHNHIYTKNGEVSGKKLSKRSMGTQVPKNGLRCGFKRIFETKEMQTDPYDGDRLHSDEIFMMLDRNLNEIDVLIGQFMKAKSPDEILIAKEKLQKEFGNFFKSEKEFLENLQHKFFSFEYVVWRHYFDTLFEIDTIETSSLTRKFIKKFFTEELDKLKHT